MKTNPLVSVPSGALAALLVLLALAGCSTHSWWIIGDTVTTQTAAGRFPAHTNRVLLTASGLPPGVKFESLGTLDAGKVTTANTEALLLLMAREGRRVGANAVIHLRLWRQPSGWSWNAPHGSGEAIRVADTNALSSLTGYWY